MNFGLSLIHSRNNFYANPIIDGDYAFNGQTTGLGLADFLLGMPSRNRQAPPSGTLRSSTYIAAYIADTWKATPRLTVNAGVRWEPFIPQTVRNGTVGIYSEERYKAGIKSTVFRNAPAGFCYPGDPDFPGDSCRDSGICKASAINNRWWEFDLASVWRGIRMAMAGCRSASVPEQLIGAQWRLVQQLHRTAMDADNHQNGFSCWPG